VLVLRRHGARLGIHEWRISHDEVFFDERVELGMSINDVWLCDVGSNREADLQPRDNSSRRYDPGTDDRTGVSQSSSAASSSVILPFDGCSSALHPTSTARFR
jgi:hypothetical protein